MNESGLNQTKLTDENMELNGKPPMGPMSMDMQMTFKHELPLNLIFQEIELHTLKGGFHFKSRRSRVRFLAKTTVDFFYILIINH